MHQLLPLVCQTSKRSKTNYQKDKGYSAGAVFRQGSVLVAIAPFMAARNNHTPLTFLVECPLAYSGLIVIAFLTPAQDLQILFYLFSFG
jgi:hypothetical protein